MSIWLRPNGHLRYHRTYFNKKMDEVLEDYEGAIGISDDICVYSRITAEYDRNLRKTMDTARKSLTKTNAKKGRNKCKIRQERIKFYGLIWDKIGSRPDPENCERIKSKPKPTNREEFQQFLGMIQYLSPFIPELRAKKRHRIELE